MARQLDETKSLLAYMNSIDASLTTAELAERVGLSPSPCWRRIDRLERDGYIKGRVAVVDRRKVGLHAHIFAQVKLNAHGRANLDEFSAAIAAFPDFQPKEYSGRPRAASARLPKAAASGRSGEWGRASTASRAIAPRRRYPPA